jgi:very-short-patch-repair endonuclease
MARPDRYANRLDLLAIRRDLRARSTPAERALWQMLRISRVCGFKFRRQHSIDRYVVDFYCPEVRVAIELDGGIHDDPLRAEYDRRRQRDLEERGVSVLRFRNEAVLSAPDLMILAIVERLCPEDKPPMAL